MYMAYVHHRLVLECGHVATLFCTNSRAIYVSLVLFFFFLDRGVLFSPVKMPVRQMISSQVLKAAEFCALVKALLLGWCSRSPVRPSQCGVSRISIATSDRPLVVPTILRSY